MRRLCVAGVALLGLIAYFTLGGRAADEKKLVPADAKGVEAATAAFADAFNEGDAAKVAAAFTPDAEFIDDAGNGVRSREEIQKVFTGFLTRNKGAKIQLTLDEARQVAPDVVIQDGESVCTVPAKNTQSTRRYAVTFVRLEKKWLIGSLREFPEESSDEDNPDRIKDLSYMIGEWVDEGENGAVATTCRWSQDKHYILRDFTVKLKGKDVMTGIQRIGVDPMTKQIKGWAFDSQNGHGETVWVKNGDQWLVKASGVTSEGEFATATYIFKPLSKDRVLWKTMHRVVGDRVEPDIEVTMVRKGPVPK
jgi:uncharacterized protein (TIGR02246 family)